MVDIKENFFYLGTLMFVGHNKMTTFEFLKSKVKNRLAM